MDDEPDDTTGVNRRRRLLEQLDSMVGSGRVTDEEAARLRAAHGAEEFDEVVRDISVRHARLRLDTAVEDGSLSQEEAARFIERLQAGEHPRSLRARLGALRRGHRPPGA
jgi:polyhydroxyalkanoate synthesis regulator phasin